MNHTTNHTMHTETPQVVRNAFEAAADQKAVDLVLNYQSGYYTPVKNARELAEISQAAQRHNIYDRGFEDALAHSLKISQQKQHYKRSSVPTPPPQNLMENRQRVV